MIDKNDYTCEQILEKSIEKSTFNIKKNNNDEILPLPQEVKEHLKKIKYLILEDYEKYDLYAKNGNYDLIPKDVTYSDDTIKIDKRHFEHLYEYGLRDRNRDIYDHLLLKSFNCCYCNLSESYNLDHFLSKSVYPNFSVFKENLVPCCSKCNGKKGTYDRSIVENEDFFPNPNFDDLKTIKWLDGTLYYENGTIFFDFFVCDKLDEKLKKRFEKMLTKLGLKERYALKANDIFYYEQIDFMKLFKEGSFEELKKEIEKCFNKHYSSVNDIKKVYYQVLLNNIDILEKYLTDKSND